MFHSVYLIHCHLHDLNHLGPQHHHLRDLLVKKAVILDDPLDIFFHKT